MITAESLDDFSLGQSHVPDASIPKHKLPAQQQCRIRTSQSDSNARDDKRKNNRGLDHRRSYLKEEKIVVMWLKDAGRSADEIANLTAVSKSNIEKWCSDKARATILTKYRVMPHHEAIDKALRSDNQVHFNTSDRDAMADVFSFLMGKLRVHSSESEMHLEPEKLRQAGGLLLQTPTSTVHHNNGNTSSYISTNEVHEQQAPKRRKFLTGSDDSVQYAADLLQSFGTTTAQVSTNSLSSSYGRRNRRPKGDSTASASVEVAPVIRKSSRRQVTREFGEICPDDEDSYATMNSNDYSSSCDEEECQKTAMLLQELTSEPMAVEEKKEVERMHGMNSDFKMEYFERLIWYNDADCSDNPLSRNVITTGAPVQAVRPVLKNTKFFMKRRIDMGLKVRDKEEEEDETILAMLGE